MAKKMTRRRRVGCSIELTTDGFFRVRWRNPDGKHCARKTGERDTPEGRAKIEILQRRIGLAVSQDKDPDVEVFGRKQKAAQAESRVLLRDYLTTRYLPTRSPYRPDGSVIDDPELLAPTTYAHVESTIARYYTDPVEVGGQTHDLGSIAVSDVRQLRDAFRAFRAALHVRGLKTKTVNNITGVAHAALQVLVDDSELPSNPVPKLKVKKREKPTTKKPLEPSDIQRILDALPARLDLRTGAHVTRETLRDLYTLWSRTGWRSNEYTALKFEHLDFERRTVDIVQGRSPRSNPKTGAKGVEAAPKTGERYDLACAFDPTIFKIFERRRKAALPTGQTGYVFTDSTGEPLDQELLHKRVWKPTLRILRLNVGQGEESRSQYVMRHSFIAACAKAGERIAWVAHFTGTSRQMVERHYDTFVPEQNQDAGRAFAAHVDGRLSLGLSPRRGTIRNSRVESTGKEWRRGESNPRPKALDRKPLHA